MKRILSFVFLLLFATMINSCSKKNEQGSSTASYDEPRVSSENFRKAFNEVSSEMFDIQWTNDLENPSTLNLDKGELFVAESSRRDFGLSQTGLVVDTPEIQRAFKIITDRLEEKRQKALDLILNDEVEHHSTFDMAVLTRPNRDAARILIDAGYLVGDLYKLQNHPNTLVYESELIKSGDPLSLKFIKRMLSPVAKRGGIYANAVKTFPDPMTGSIMWPAEMNSTVFAELKAGAQETDDPFLSPFTVIKRTKDLKLIHIPYSAYPPFVDRLKEISKKLALAARVPGIDPSFANQLALQSEAMVSRSPYPFYSSDEAWVKSQGQLELIIGPYESERDPYSTKAFYEFMFGAENPKATKFLDELKKLLPEIEDGIAKTAQSGTYQPRAISENPRLRIVDVILATGLSAGDEGPHLATILPNVGPMSTEKERKTIIMANHHEAKLPLLKSIGDATLTPVMSDLIDADAFIKFSILRTLMHDLGPQGDVKLSSGKTSEESVGDFFNSIKQAKAGAAAAWTANLLATKGIITQDELKQVYATYVANLFRYIAIGLDTPHGEGAAAEFSYLVSNGALRKNGFRLEVDMEKFHPVVCAYLGEIVDAMATGNAQKSEELLYGYTSRASEYLLQVTNYMNRAKTPRDVAIYYHIEGL